MRYALLLFLVLSRSCDGRRGACPIYVWDLNSALRHNICSRLSESNTYCGRGGAQFVRIHHNSPLVRLWPCENHLPDACAICGHPKSEHRNPISRRMFQKYRDEYLAWKAKRSEVAQTSAFARFVSATRAPPRGISLEMLPLRDTTCQQLIRRRIMTGNFNISDASGEPFVAKMAFANGVMTILLSEAESKDRAKEYLGVS